MTIVLRSWVPLAVLLILAGGVCLSVFGFLSSRAALQREAESAYQKAFQERVSHITQSIERKITLIESIAGLFDFSSRVTREEFDGFTLRSLRANSGVLAFEWVPRITAEMRDDFEHAVDHHGRTYTLLEPDAQGVLMPAGARAEYFPVYFVQPREGSENLVGFDLGADAARRETLEHARDSGMPQASARITLLQDAESSSHSGFLVAYPIYRKGSLPLTREERREGLQGFVVGVSRFEDVITAALRNLEPRGILFTFDDRGDHSNGHMYSHINPASAYARMTLAAAPQDLLHAQISLPVVGREWVISGQVHVDVFRNRQAYRQTWWVLLGGLAVSALLAIAFMRMAAHTARITAVVGLRNRELSNHEQHLNDIIRSTQAGTWRWNITSGELECNARWAEIIGYRLEELAPVTLDKWLARVHPADLPILKQQLERQTTPSSEPCSCEYRVRHKGGFWVWVHDRGAVSARNEIGEPRTVSGTRLDITERKSAELQLQFREITVDHSHDAVFWITEDGFLIYVNNGACTSLDYARSELLGKKIFDIDARFSAANWQSYWQEIKSHGSQMLESRQQKKTVTG